MIKLAAIAVYLVMLSSCNNEGGTAKETDSSSITTTNVDTMQNHLTDQQKADGWQLLFDGQTASGWHKYGGGPVGSAWKIADGTLYLDTASKKDGKIVGGGDIVTSEEYENFHLQLDWKISPNGNSGIMFYVIDDSVKYKKPYETGPEMQVLDNEGHRDGKIIKHRAGDLYDLISSSKETVKPVGEWNHAEIKAMNGKLDFYLNGENVVSTTMWDDNWKQMLAKSKFKEWKDFGTYKKGKICLQDHDNLVWYRNIMIKKL